MRKEKKHNSKMSHLSRQQISRKIIGRQNISRKIICRIFFLKQDIFQSNKKQALIRFEPTTFAVPGEPKSAGDAYQSI